MIEEIPQAWLRPIWTIGCLIACRKGRILAALGVVRIFFSANDHHYYAAGRIDRLCPRHSRMNAAKSHLENAR